MQNSLNGKKSIDPFHNDIQFEAKDASTNAARNLPHIIMVQLHKTVSCVAESNAGFRGFDPH